MTGKAGVIASATRPGNPQQILPRGSSLENFFDHCCDRPGYYQGFAHERRSPGRRFCSHTFDQERKEDGSVLHWTNENLLDLKTSEIGEHYGRYRLHVPEAERAMAKSLERYGQLSPVVVCRRQDRYEVIDGFKRLGAAQRLIHLDHLSARLMEADERAVKATIYGLNRAGGRTRELGEVWIIHALLREDGMSRVEVAELLGRHKSWVCRRLVLIERLGPQGSR